MPNFISGLVVGILATMAVYYTMGYYPRAPQQDASAPPPKRFEQEFDRCLIGGRSRESCLALIREFMRYERKAN